MSRRSFQSRGFRGKKDPLKNSNQSTEETLRKLDSLRQKTKQSNIPAKVGSGLPVPIPMAIMGVGIIVIIGMAGLGLFNFPTNTSNPPTNIDSGNNSDFNIANFCVDHGAIDRHSHFTLQLSINGNSQILPINIGVGATCMHPLHTHAADNKVHVESGAGLDSWVPKIQDFFTIWSDQDSSRTMTNTSLLGLSGSLTAMVDGSAYTSGYIGDAIIFDGAVVSINISTL